MQHFSRRRLEELRVGPVSPVPFGVGTLEPGDPVRGVNATDLLLDIAEGY